MAESVANVSHTVRHDRSADSLECSGLARSDAGASATDVDLLSCSEDPSEVSECSDTDESAGEGGVRQQTPTGWRDTLEMLDCSDIEAEDDAGITPILRKHMRREGGLVSDSSEDMVNAADKVSDREYGESLNQNDLNDNQCVGRSGTQLIPEHDDARYIELCDSDSESRRNTARRKGRHSVGKVVADELEMRRKSEAVPDMLRSENMTEEEAESLDLPIDPSNLHINTLRDDVAFSPDTCKGAAVESEMRVTGVEEHTRNNELNSECEKANVLHTDCEKANGLNTEHQKGDETSTTDDMLFEQEGNTEAGSEQEENTAADSETDRNSLDSTSESHQSKVEHSTTEIKALSDLGTRPELAGGCKETDKQASYSSHQEDGSGTTSPNREVISIADGAELSQADLIPDAAEAVDHSKGHITTLDRDVSESDKAIDTRIHALRNAHPSPGSEEINDERAETDWSVLDADTLKLARESRLESLKIARAALRDAMSNFAHICTDERLKKFASDEGIVLSGVVGINMSNHPES